MSILIHFGETSKLVDLGAQQNKTFKKLTTCSEELLNELNHFHKEYSSLGRNSPRKYNKLRWPHDKAEEFRQRIHKQMLTWIAYNFTIMSTSISELCRLIQEQSKEHREEVSFTADPPASKKPESDTGWVQSLVDCGVSHEVVELVETSYKRTHSQSQPTSQAIFQRALATTDEALGTVAFNLASDELEAPSDISSDGESVFSLAASTTSSISSLVPEQTAHPATHELINLFLGNEEFRLLSAAAIKSDRIGVERLERNFRRLLNQYSVDLKHEARSEVQRAAVYFVHSRSRYIASGFRREMVKLSIDGATYKGGYNRSEDIGSDSDSEDNDPDDDGSEPQSREYLYDLSRAKDFMISGTAFLKFRDNFRQFVYPSSKSQHYRVIAELSASNPSKITSESFRSQLISLIMEFELIQPRQVPISYQDVWSLLNHVKGVVEDLTGETWEWWPLKPRIRSLAAGYARLHWRCLCGEELWEEVPVYFAKALARPIQETPHSSNTHPLDSGKKLAHSTSHNTNVAQTWGISHTASSDQEGSQATHPASAKSSSANPINAPPFNPSSNVDVLGTRTTYVLMGVGAGDFRLAQMAVQDCQDDHFFEQLRGTYNELRGLFRRYLGIWQYAHCDFVKFEKFDDNSIVPRGPGVPDPSNGHYQYNPKPVEHMPPISTHEFRRRFYACYRRHPSLSTKFWCYFHTCKVPCRRSRAALDRIPKKSWRLEEGGDAREFFWGINAVERISFLMVAIYHLMILLPPFIFWFLWLFWWGHSGDLQNASAPFLSALGLISLLWFPLLNK